MKQTLKRLFSFSVNAIASACLVMWFFGIAHYSCLAADFDDRRPSEHFCPITYEVMRDPVVAADGYSYERTAIETYFKSSHTAKSPMTGLPLLNKTLVNNQALKTIINDWTPNILAKSFSLSGDADILVQRIRVEFQRNAALLDSSNGQHIVAFLGNAGAGKSTLVNLLAGKEIVVSDDGEDYVLAYPDDKAAMVIRTGGNSETLYPKFIDVDDLRFFDLSGFNDMDGSERNLVNAALTKRILLNAASVRLVFVVSQDQFTADKSDSVKQMFHCAKQLFIVGDQNASLVDDGVFVATKITCNEKTEMMDFLLKKTDFRNKADLHEQLKSWSERNRLCRMFHPLREAHNKDARYQILNLIKETRSTKILDINVSVLYPQDENEALKKMFLSILEGSFNRSLYAPLETMSDYNKVMDFYESDNFWSIFDETVRAEENVIGLLKEFCVNHYNKALITLEKKNEGKRRKYIQSLRNRREEEEKLQFQRMGKEKHLVNMRLAIPLIAQGYEKIYERFLRGVLIYRPQEKNDIGRIDLPIAALQNPLGGTFDLSQCGDISEYLSISTGYCKEREAANNKGKMEIWFAPRFLIKREMKTTANHFQEVFDNWVPRGEVGIFWRWGGWSNLTWYDYLVTQTMDELSGKTVYEQWHSGAKSHNSYTMRLLTAPALCIYRPRRLTLYFPKDV